MAKEIGGRYGVLPKISEDYYQRGSTSKAKGFEKEKFLSRKEVLENLERNFPKAYQEETGEKLAADAKGIVVWQCGLLPYNNDIEISPQLKSHASYSVKDMNKVLKMPYAFESRTYWLEKGKITLLLTPETVLEDKAAEKVVMFLLDKNGWHGVINKGIYNVPCGVHQRPCRVYEVEDKLVLLNLTNGVINIVPSTQELEPIDVSKEFHCGYIRFRKETRGYVKL